MKGFSSDRYITIDDNPNAIVIFIYSSGVFIKAPFSRYIGAFVNAYANRSKLLRVSNIYTGRVIESTLLPVKRFDPIFLSIYDMIYFYASTFLELTNSKPPSLLSLSQSSFKK